MTAFRLTGCLHRFVTAKILFILFKNLLTSIIRNFILNRISMVKNLLRIHSLSRCHIATRIRKSRNMPKNSSSMDLAEEGMPLKFPIEIWLCLQKQMPIQMSLFQILTQVKKITKIIKFRLKVRKKWPSSTLFTPTLCSLQS